MVKRKTKSEESAGNDDKKRALAISRANARKWKEASKRKAESSSGSPSSSEDRPSAKKPRRKPRVPQTKKEKRLDSRKRAKRYGEGLPTATSGGESDDGDSGDDDMETSDTIAPQPAYPPPDSPPRPRSAPRRSGNHHGSPIPLQPPPPMPQTPPPVSNRSSSRTRVQPVREGGSPPPWPSPSQARTSFRLPSFLQYGVKSDVTGPVPAASTLNGGCDKNGLQNTPAGNRRSKRQSFLRYAPDSKRQHEAMAVPVPVEAAAEAAATADAGADDANPPENGRRQGRAGIWAFNCVAVVLAPILACCLLWVVRSGVVLAWPRVQIAAGGALGVFSGLTAKSTFEDKCFLHQSEQDQVATICKEGTEPAECPEHAECGAGRILACNFPFTVAQDRASCVLSTAAQEEANAVVKALRTSTIEQLCQGSGIIMPKSCSSRSSMTLTEAAAAQNRGPLSLLAVMPPGNVAGLIDLEGNPATECGEGEDRDRTCPGSGSERLARLSESAHDAVMLTSPWRCKARLAAGRWLLAYWLYCLGFYVLILAIVYWDLRRLKKHRKRFQVCAMRDECYKALLAADASPLQVSHIQEQVADERRATEGGNRTVIQKKVRELWPLVEREVEHDTRILRNFKYIRGQPNVPCWCWVGPRCNGLESIGALDPGPAPRLWLLWWLRQPRTAP